MERKIEETEAISTEELCGMESCGNSCIELLSAVPGSWSVGSWSNIPRLLQDKDVVWLFMMSVISRS